MINAFGQPVGTAVTVALPRPRPDDRRLNGRRCSLSRLDPEADGPALHAAFATDRTGRDWTYLPYGPFDSPGTFLQWLRTASAGDDPVFYCIRNPEGVPLGMASFLRITPALGSIEIGHVHFSPRMQRTAMATEAIRLMLEYAFDTLGYRRCEWKCDALNAASRRAALRLGFTFEGIFRKAAVVKGRNRDTAWFSITDEEWPSRRQALEAWLSPDNFDCEERQIRPLGQQHDRLATDGSQGVFADQQ